MHHFHKISCIVGLAIIIGSCKSSDQAPSNGIANFTKYNAFGDDFTAGYASFGLYRTAQEVSFPNLIAQQMQNAGGGSFGQPLFELGQENGTGYQRITGFKEIYPTFITIRNNLGIRSNNPTLYAKYSGTNNNWGTPFFRMTDVRTQNAGSSSGNPFFERLLPTANTSKTYIEVVSESQSSFFTCWLGNADALLFAMSGGIKPLSDAILFANNAKELLAVLNTKDAKGVLATIPDFTKFPLLNTISVKNLQGKNNSTVYIRTGIGTTRAAGDTDLILLTAADSIGIPNAGGLPHGFFSSNPLKNYEVLDRDEVAAMQQSITAYNTTFIAEAKSKGIAVWDAYAFFEKLANSITESGIKLSNDYQTGGVFSADGTHFSARGNALVANQFIRTINEAYQSKLVFLDLSTYEPMPVK